MVVGGGDGSMWRGEGGGGVNAVRGGGGGNVHCIVFRQTPRFWNLKHV